MKKFVGFLFLFVATALIGLSPVNAEPNIKGKWKVKGKTSKGQKYTGNINIKRAFVHTVFGNYTLDGRDQETLFRFLSNAEFNGKKLTFTFQVTEAVGLVRLLGNLSEILSGNKVTIRAEYTLSEDGLSMTGTWRSGDGKISGRDVWTRDTAKITVNSALPKTVESSASTREVVFTINGTNFPDKANLSPKDIQFLLNGQGDGNIRVVEVLEVNDLGTSVKVKVAVEPSAAPGKRDIKVKEGHGKELVEVKKSALRMPLGGSVEVPFGSPVKVFIPQGEGKLTLSGGKIKKVYIGSVGGEEIEKNENGEYLVPSHGWVFIVLEDGSSVSNKYVIEAETPEDKKPWNFWYFPFVENSRDGRNLYKDGEAYEKLDKVFGITPKKDGWKEFNVFEHMDWWAESKSVREQLFKAFYEANSNQDWNKLNELRAELLDLHKKKENASSEDERDKYEKEFNKKLRKYQNTLGKYQRKFKMDALSDEMKKKYNPTTMQGYAYCYQRSKDSSKSWWGHCWGAVVASSLWAQPEAKSVKGADGKTYEFSVEEVEGLITAYYTDHSVFPKNYMSDCPAGPPTEATGEKVDQFCDDFFLGLIQGIQQDGLPLACNLRASRTGAGKDTQVWNHVVWKFKAELKEVEGSNDETLVEVKLTTGASRDVFTSENSKGTRDSTYKFALKYNTDGTIDRDNEKHQNWTSASSYAPSYLWRILRSTSPNKTKNAVLRGKLDKIVDTFGYKRIK